MIKKDKIVWGIFALEVLFYIGLVHAQQTPSIFSTVGGELVSKVLGSILYFGLAIILVAVLAGIVYYFLVYRKKFDIRVKIISNRAYERNAVLFDKAAIIYGFKDKLPYFRIWGLKRDFPVPSYDVLQKTNEGDYLEIYRDGENDFYFLTPSKIVKTQVIRADGKVIGMAEHRQNLIDSEMAYWNLQRKKDNKKMFDTEGWLMKLIPFLPQIFGGVIMIFVLYILMDNLPSILEQLRQLAETINQQTAAQIVTRG